MKSVAVTTLNPSYLGGIYSMMTIAYDALSGEFAPTLVFAGKADTTGGRFRKWMTRLFRSDYEDFVLNGMNCRRVSSGMGIHHSLAYCEFSGSWKAALTGYDGYFCVGGSAHSALPLMMNRKRYSVWVATPYLDDRIDRRKAMSFLKRWTDRLFYPLAFLQERAILRAAEHVYALSEYTKTKLMQHHALPERKVECLGYPVDTDRFSPVAGSAQELSVLFTGRLNDPRKNVECLVRAFRIVLNVEKTAKLVLIGDLLSPQYVKLIEALGLQGNVVNKAYLSNEDLLKYYQKSRVFVIPSNQEGLCISALEALSCGVPVVSTKCGGPEEFVLDGESGYQIPKDDANAMAEKILHLLQHRDLYNTMSRRAREIACARYGKNVIAEKFATILREQVST